MTIKKSLIVIFFLFIAHLTAFSQSDYKTKVDREGEKILVGKLSLPLLANDSSFHWFYQGINTYTPDPKAVNTIKKNKDNFTLVAVIGTWDSQSQKTISALYKTLINAGYPIDKIKLYGVDEKLKPLRSDMNYDVKKIPTIIVYDKSGSKIGMLDMEAHSSIEQAMATLVK